MVEQEGLFETQIERPEDSPFVLAIVARFDGYITAIQEVKVTQSFESSGGPSVWIETLHPRAERYKRRAASDGGGHPILEQVTYVVRLGKFGGWEKDKPKGSCQPWRYVWSRSGMALNMGLFTTREAAESWRKR